jgi:hypothetical protein
MVSREQKAGSESRTVNCFQEYKLGTFAQSLKSGELYSTIQSSFSDAKQSSCHLQRSSINTTTSLRQRRTLTGQTVSYKYNWF